MKAVKANYAAIVIALESFYEQTHEPEALGINKALSRKSTVIAMFLLDFVLPQVAKLSKCLQTEKFDSTAISGLVDSTLKVFFLASFSIFDPSKLPQKDSPDLSSYGDEFIGILKEHYCEDLPAKSVQGGVCHAIFGFSDIHTE